MLVLLYLQAHDETEVADSQLLLSYLLFGQSRRHHPVLCDDIYTGRIVRKEIEGVEIHDREEGETHIKWYKKIPLIYNYITFFYS